MLPLLNVVFLQSGLQVLCCFLECHPRCQCWIQFLPFRDAPYCDVCLKNREKLLCKTKSHCAQSHCFMNSDWQKSQKFWIFVQS